MIKLDVLTVHTSFRSKPQAEKPKPIAPSPRVQDEQPAVLLETSSDHEGMLVLLYRLNKGYLQGKWLYVF